jgi:multicomponent K+:H+ antiporter subunit E
MKRLLPFPALSVTLLLLWLLLMESIDPGTLLLGAALALFWPFVTRQLMTPPIRFRRPLVALRLFLRVIGDMLRGNFTVAAQILLRRPTSLRSGFVEVPLDLRDHNGLAALAAIVTFTPGTAWAQIGAGNRVLLLHVLDVDDADAIARAIKDRYETPLRQVFE